MHKEYIEIQKEVAERICEKKGSKTYGILSVLTQAFYDTEYLFTVSSVLSRSSDLQTFSTQSQPICS